MAAPLDVVSFFQIAPPGTSLLRGFVRSSSEGRVRVRSLDCRWLTTQVISNIPTTPGACVVSVIKNGVLYSYEPLIDSSQSVVIGTAATSALSAGGHPSTSVASLFNAPGTTYTAEMRLTDPNTVFSMAHSSSIVSDTLGFSSDARTSVRGNYSYIVSRLYVVVFNARGAPVNGSWETSVLCIVTRAQAAAAPITRERVPPLDLREPLDLAEGFSLGIVDQDGELIEGRLSIGYFAAHLLCYVDENSEATHGA